MIDYDSEPGSWAEAIRMRNEMSNTRSEQIGGDHYRTKAVQPWDAMAAWMTPEQFEGFLRGNAIKYLARAGSKGDAVVDYKKARHYLDKLIEVVENGK
jgi:hypothetical protein